MSVRFPRGFVAVVVVLALAGCNQSKPGQPASNTPPVAPPPPVSAPQPPLPPPPPAIPPATEQPISTVDSVSLTRPQDAPDAIVVHVSGTTLSSGWTDPKLSPVEENLGADGVKTYKFVATSPAAPALNRMPQTIEAEIRVLPVPPDLKAIRVVAAGNEVLAPITQ